MSWKAGVGADDVLELFPYGVLVLARDTRVLVVNKAVRDLLGDQVDGDGARCCDLFGCRQEGTPLAGGCLTELALAADEPLPEIRVDLGEDAPAGAVWVTAASLGTDQTRVVAHLRAGDPHDRRRRTTPHWTAGAQLRVAVLGRTRVYSTEGSLGGNWLNQRPGQLFKYLLCHRDRVVHVEEIAETLWPNGDQRVVNNVRHFVHALREKLEPARERRAASRFVIAEHGGYRLNLDNIRVDADVFEDGVRRGLEARDRGDKEEATRLLSEAVALYGGDFLADERYMTWAASERDRLQELAAGALTTLGEECWRAGALDEAATHLERVALMHPFDQGVERQLIAIALQRGRHSVARRRYVALRARMLREFGEELDFDLADVAESLDRPGGAHAPQRI